MITKKKKSQLQEKKVADEINADVVVASGALWGSKGDVRSDELLIECKTTDNSYYVFHFATWDKIRKEAIKDGLRIPVMSIDILGGKRRFAVFNSKDFEEHKGFKDMYFGTYALYVYKGSFRLTDPCIK